MKPVILYDVDQKPMAVQNGVVIPSGATGLPILGSDGTNLRFLKTDAAGILFEQISDGTTGPVAVKPPSTPPVAADKALVVVISPNQQALPVTPALANSVTGIISGRIVLGGGTTNTIQAIRATTYNEPTVNGQRSISSSSASDTAAGVGARTVLITYFDATGAGPFTESKILNGVAAVATTATNICFIESMVVQTVGTTGANVGTITLFVNNAGGGGTIGTIGTGNLSTGVGDNTTLWAHHYVPASKLASIATLIISAASGGSGTLAMFLLRAKNPINTNDAELIVSDVLLATSEFSRQFSISSARVTGFKRLVAYGVPGVNNATLQASFDYSEATP